MVNRDQFYDVAFPWVQEAEQERALRVINAWSEAVALRPLRQHAGATYGKLIIDYDLTMIPGKTVSFVLERRSCADCARTDAILESASFDVQSGRRLTWAQLFRSPERRAEFVQLVFIELDEGMPGALSKELLGDVRRQVTLAAGGHFLIDQEFLCLYFPRGALASAEKGVPGACIAMQAAAPLISDSVRAELGISP